MWALDHPFQAAVLVVLTLLAYDIVKYYSTRGSLAGAPYIRGGLFGIYAIFDVILHPVDFWTRQKNYASNHISTNTMFGRVMFYVTNTVLCKQIFVNTEDFVLFAHPNADFLFGSENLIYMDPLDHKRFRTLLMAGVYSPDALKTYLGYQISVCRKHLQSLSDGSSPELGRGRIHDGLGMTEIREGESEARLAFRLMNADASQESFAGPYLTQANKDTLSEDILVFTLGFLAFPLPIPFMGLSKAIAARERIRKLLMPVAQAAKDYISSGGYPRCVMDYWAKEIVDNSKGIDVNNSDMASTVLDFLFASQDATTSAVVWALDILEDRPEELAKIRQELEEKGKGKESLEEYFDDCEYLHATAYEILRYRPPVPMVPHMAKKNVTLSDGTYVPKGTYLLPAIADAAVNEPGADVYEPNGRYADKAFKRVMVFGQGQHMCPGRKYAWQLVAVFVSLIATEFDFTRRKTSKSTNTVYFPTLIPEDNLYKFKSRKKVS